MKKEPSTKFYAVLDLFSWAYEVTKLWMIKGCVRYILLACFLSLKENTGETNEALFVLEKIKF